MKTVKDGEVFQVKNDIVCFTETGKSRSINIDLIKKDSNIFILKAYDLCSFKKCPMHKILYDNKISYVFPHSFENEGAPPISTYKNALGMTVYKIN